MIPQPDVADTAEARAQRVLLPVTAMLDGNGEGAFVRDVLASATADPLDPEPYEAAIALAVALGRRDLALACLRDTQNAFPDMPLVRSRDFLMLQKDGVRRGIPPLMLNTQFKSGSMFLSRRLASAVSVPHCYISRTPIEDRIVPEWLTLFAAGGALCQEHLPPDPETIALLAGSGIGRMLVHVRDPRQSMISALHHYAKGIGTTRTDGFVMKAELPPGYADWPFAERAEHYIETRLADQVRWIADWAAAADESANGGANGGIDGLEILLTEYTALRNDPDGLFAALVDFFRIPRDQVIWDRLEGAPKKGKLHYRKGDVDEWRRVLTPDQARRASALIPDALKTRFDWPE
jgi:hypothetical protein